jgi:predicted dehydrogenase
MSEPLSVGLIGTGFMGEFHARAYNRVERLMGVPVRLAVVADVSEEPARAFATRWGIPSATGEWRDVVADPSLDAVDICTPPALHREIGLAAIANGKHVYCEKPVGLTAADTQALADAARVAGIRTCVGFNYRWFPAVQHAAALIRAGELGAIRHARMTFESDWASDPSVPWAWRLDHTAAGYGALSDVGSHVFDMARLLVGEIASISGITRTFVKERSSDAGTRQVDTDDSFDATAEFTNGAIGEFHGSRVATGSKVEFRFEIVGERGALRWEVGRLNELRRYELRAGVADDGFTTIFLGPDHPLQAEFSPVQGLGLGFEDSKVIELATFLRAVVEDTDLSPNFDDALAVARILDAVAAGGWVRLAGDGGGAS